MRNERVVPTPAIRLLLCVGALTAALLLSVAGSGLAIAEPDTSSKSGETGGNGETGPVSEPAPTVATPTEPKGLLGQLHDFLHRPRSVFGNGRVPGQPPTTILTAQGHPKSSTTKQDESKATSGEESTKPETGPAGKPTKPETGPVGEPTKPDPPVEEPTKRDPPVDEPPGKPEPPTKPDPIGEPPGKPDPTGEHPGKPNPGPPDPPAPQQKSAGSLASLVLPGAFTFSIPLPTFPGTADLQWSWDLSNPTSALSSVQDNVAQLGALVQNVVAPFNPFPKPPPRPTLRILEEEPVVESSGGDGPPVGVGAPDLPVLQAPMALPSPRLGPPRPLTELVPAGASSPQVLGVGSAGVQGPGVRGSVTQGQVQAGEPAAGSTTSPMGNTAFRQGYSQYLRTARVTELATVALPGIAGLLAITASGGVIGYRQANSGRFVRADTARFLR
jgi:hypothetical protein